MLNVTWILTSFVLCLAASDPNSTDVSKDETPDSKLRTAISNCFTWNPVGKRRDDTAYVTSDEVRLTPLDWWPPGPVTLNMIRVLRTVCRSQEFHVSTNRCITDVYSSAAGSDLRINMALTQLPLPEAWEELQEEFCISSSLTEDLPCVAHLQFSVYNCIRDQLSLNQSMPYTGRRRFLVCRQLDASEDCQRHVYKTCSRQTSLTLAAVTHKLNPALCPLEHVTTTTSGTSCHVTSTTLKLFSLFSVVVTFYILLSPHVLALSWLVSSISI